MDPYGYMQTYSNTDFRGDSVLFHDFLRLMIILIIFCLNIFF